MKRGLVGNGKRERMNGKIAAILLVFFIAFVLGALPASAVMPDAASNNDSQSPVSTNNVLKADTVPGSVKGEAWLGKKPEKNYKEGELLVKFKSGVSEDSREKLHKKHGSEKIKEFAFLRIHLVKLKNGLRVEEAIRLYEADPDVEYAGPNHIVTAQSIPNDPLFNQLWGLYNTGLTGGIPGADIKAPAAWDITQGSNDVVVVVIDTGVDYTHPDLAANMWVNSGEIPGNGIDDDGDGYIDDVHGINVMTGKGDPMDDMGHGTHCSGTIGAVGNNGIGVVGVNWNVKIMACKFLDSSGSGDTAGAVTCLEYVRMMKNRGVHVVATSNSWGCGPNDLCFDQALYDAINAQRDILFFAAGGNANADNETFNFYPANFYLPNLMAVAATNKYDSRASFSDFGKHSVSVGAPGESIMSTLPAINAWGITGGYGLLSGTSMATPHVSGLAALIKSQDMTRDWRAIKNLILSGGDDNASLNGITITGKRINAYGSLTCANRPVFSALKCPAFIEAGVQTTLSALSINCESPVGPVAVTTSGGETVTLHDDGIAPDLAAGDGIFSSTWTPVTDAAATLVFSSPSGAETIAVPKAMPDLVISSLTVPARASAGTAISLTDTTKNSGTGSTRVTSTTKFYFSSDTVFDASDVLLGGRDIGQLARGETSTGSVTVTVPAGTPAGTYSIIAVADADKTVDESNENNNTLYKAIAVGPDLVISSLTVPGTAPAGALITLTDTMKNQGSDPAGKAVTKYYFSKDGVLDGSDVLLGSRATPVLAAGGTNSGSVTVTVPVGTPVGAYYIIAVADADKAVAESDENNNTFARSIGVGPDLVVSSLTLPTTVSRGVAMSITDTTANNGSDPAGSSVTKFYFSIDGFVDSSDILLGSRDIPALAPSGSSAGSTTVTIPAGTPMGFYYIIAAADADSVVPESYENNNITYKSIGIGPDLTITAMSTPGSADAGMAITITDTTQNIGSEPTVPTVTNYYLQTPEFCYYSVKNAVLLGSRSLPSLGGVETSSGAVSVIIPAGTAKGQYCIIAVADSEKAVAELDESNNMNYAVIEISPNKAPTVAGLSGAAVNDYMVSFTDASADAPGNVPYGITSDTVDWGDGATASQAAGTVFTHTYATASTYTITHTVTDAAHLSAFEKQTLIVPTMYGVSGTVTHGNPAAGLSGVSVYLQYLGSTGTWTTKATRTTATNGTYDFGKNWIPGTYKVIPYKSKETFSPIDRTITLGPDATRVDFTATP